MTPWSEISLALAVSLPSAEKTTRAAWELGARLPGVELLLRDGTLDVPRARLITEVFAELSDENAARAEELLLPELTAPPRKTYTQIERIATAIAAAVDPGLAERRRESAEKLRARVAMFREPSGTAALSGRDLPVDEALAAYANLDARAEQYKDSGAFPGERLDRLRAAAFLDILNGVSADARIACGHLGSDAARKTDPDAAPETNAGYADGPGDEGWPAAPDRAGPIAHAMSATAAVRPRTTAASPTTTNRTTAPATATRTTAGRPSDRPATATGWRRPGRRRSGRWRTGRRRIGRRRRPRSGDGGGPGRGGPRGGSEPHPAGGPGRHADPARTGPAGPAIAVPAAARRPAADPGRPDPPARHPPRPRRTARRGTQPRHHRPRPVPDPGRHRDPQPPHHRLHHRHRPRRHRHRPRLRQTGRSGRPAPPAAGGPPPPLVALPARINLTVTTTDLTQLRAQPQTGPPGPPGPAGTAGRSPAAARARPGDPDWCGPWTLTLPTGLQYNVNLEPVPTYECDHRNESHAYKPNDTLRHLVQVRDHTCTFPPCSRHARDSDFEHATPYDQGGRTCACNAGARSRKCHRVKQSPGWTVTQPQPGWHQWQTPRGRTYTQGPKHYPV